MKITKRKDGRYSVSIQRKGIRKYFIGNNKSEVEAKAIEYMNYYNKGLEISGGNITVDSLCDEWFELKQRQNAKSSQVRVKSILKLYIKPYLGLMRIKDVKAHHIQKMLNDIQQDHTDTTRKTFQIIKSICEYAVQNDYIVKNVASSCNINKFETKKRKILTKEEIETLENSTNKYKDFFVFLLYTGLRRGEIASLKWSDIDLKNKELHVVSSMSFVSNQGSLKSTKTNKTRNVPLLDKTLKILYSRKNKTNSIFVFSQKDGTNLTESAIKRMHESFEKDTGLKFGLHELRHTFCTILYYSGTSSLLASNIMGHSLSVMNEIYTHLDESKKEDEIKKLNDYLSK